MEMARECQKKEKVSRTYNINIVNHRNSCLMMLLLLSGDIELNPGPIKFPCGICQNAVRDGMRAVCCDECDVWYHVKCYSISPAVYKSFVSNLDTSISVIHSPTASCTPKATKSQRHFKNNSFKTIVLNAQSIKCEEHNNELKCIISEQKTDIIAE